MHQQLEKAIIIAVSAHKGMTDKGGYPYILHPLRVMNEIDSIEGKIVALLHDVVEDSNLTIENLKEEGFSDLILEAIELLTKKENQLYDDYISKIKMNELAKKVKLADLKDNMKKSRLKKITVTDKLRIKKYKEAHLFLTS